MEVVGRVRFHGTDYERGQFSEGVPLLRVSLDDSLATFLERWLSTDPPLAPVPRRGVWNVGAKARLVRIPTMTAEERAEVVARYEPVMAEATLIDEQINRAEEAIESLVWRLYGLTETMADTVRGALLPAEMLGWDGTEDED